MHNLSYTLTYDSYHNANVKLGSRVNHILTPQIFSGYRVVHFSNGLFHGLIHAIKEKWYYE